MLTRALTINKAIDERRKSAGCTQSKDWHTYESSSKISDFSPCKTRKRGPSDSEDERKSRHTIENDFWRKGLRCDLRPIVHHQGSLRRVIYED